VNTHIVTTHDVMMQSHLPVAHGNHHRQIAIRRGLRSKPKFGSVHLGVIIIAAVE
jgi:hypothetical protein